MRLSYMHTNTLTHTHTINVSGVSIGKIVLYSNLP